MIGMIILIVGVLGALLVFWRLLKLFGKDDKITGMEWFKTGTIVGAIVVIALVLSSSFVFVDVGHAVLVVDPFQKDPVTGEGLILDSVVGPSWVFKMPWQYAKDIYYSMTSTEMWTDVESGERGEYPAIHVLSKDGLDIEVDILIRYRLNSGALVELFRSFPDLRWEDRVISSVVREDVRDVISQYTAIDLIEQRETVSVTMVNTIFESLVTETSLCQAINEASIEIDLRDLDPPATFKRAIDAKLAAEQAKIQAEFEREKTLVNADAQAKERIRLAEGEAESKILIANSQAEAMRIMQEQVGEKGWEVYYSLQMLKEIAPYTKTLILTMGGEDGVPIYYQIPQEPAE